MKTTEHIAKHLREVYFGVNWSWSNIQDQLSDVSCAEARRQLGSAHSILALVYHMCYFVGGVTPVLSGGALVIRDKYSWETPDIETEEAWKALCDRFYEEAEALARAIEQLPDDCLDNSFCDEKYGVYYRNLTGIIEHLHYHLGQIVLLKKLIRDGL